MLRRRHKTPKVPKGAAQAHDVQAGAPRSRRRAREDAHVPAELRIKPHHRIAAAKPAPFPAQPTPPVPQPAPPAQTPAPFADKPAPIAEKPAPSAARSAPPVARSTPPAAKSTPPVAKPAPPVAKPAPPVAKPAPPVARPAPPAPSPPSAAPEIPEAPRSRFEEVVLVTGFEPFGGEKSNPSWDICNRLPREIAGLRVEICRVPCEFRRSIEVVAAAIEKYRPALILCLGQAGGRAQMSVERVAINVDDARIADNAGAQPIDEPIASNRPPAYFATLPVKAMAKAMREAAVPTEVSNSAGTYVCNHLMYGVLHFLAASRIEARAGFIHVPYAEAQVLDRPATASMAVATMARGVEAAIAAAQKNMRDLKIAGGALD
jgi:pyroglutamyl-peptidase